MVLGFVEKQKASEKPRKLFLLDEREAVEMK